MNASNTHPNSPNTERESHYDNLEQMSVREILTGINTEDANVPPAIADSLDQIERLIEAAVPLFVEKDGRLFYMGSGTSGRLGIVDASECPPTYGVSPEKVQGIIAGGDQAIRQAQEFAEDDTEQGWKDLKDHNISDNDIVIGISASGTTPYVIGAMRRCRENGITTGGITCSPGGPLEQMADYPVSIDTGPEFVTGSTRMKGGTAQKLVLNMISTTLMIRLGKVRGNKMVDMQLTNEKLIKRGTVILQAFFGWEADKAKEELLKAGSVRKAINAHQ